jgi:hypothetical protein
MHCLNPKCDNAMQEAKQAVELIGKWETIDVADALELLSPDFESDEVYCLPPLFLHLSGFILFTCL